METIKTIEELLVELERQGVQDKALRRREAARKASETRRRRREEAHAAQLRRVDAYQALDPAVRDAIVEKLRVACTE